MRSATCKAAALKTGAVALLLAVCAQAKVYDAQAYLEAEFGEGLGKAGVAARAAALEALAERIRPGDALMLPTVDFGRADLSVLPDDVEISRGRRGSIFLGGRHSNMVIVDCPVPIEVGALRRPLLGKASAASGAPGLYNSIAVNTAALNGGPYANDGFLEQTTFGTHNIAGMTNCSMIYFDYNIPNCGAGATRTTPSVTLSGDFSNTRIYHMVETNYCLGVPSVLLNQVKGPLTFTVGDTERAYGIIYLFNACSDITFATHRMMATSNAGDANQTAHPPVSIKLQNGTNNKLFMSQDIGSPYTFSVDGATETGLEIWGGFWEDEINVKDDILEVFSTRDGYGRDFAFNGGFHEPVEVQDEVVFKYQGVDLSNEANKGKANPPKPPVIPPAGFPAGKLAKATSPRYVERPDFGAEVVAAGADPTGRRPSDAAFEDVLRRRGMLEIPAGTYTITRPLVLDNMLPSSDPYASGRGIMGAGPGRTTIRQLRSDIPAVKLMDIRGLNKADTTGPVNPNRTSVSNLTIEGGNWGLDLTCLYYAGKRFVNLNISGQTVAGVMCGDGKVGTMAVNQAPCNAHEFDQNRFIKCRLENTGDYGIYNNMGMTDKGLFLECDFIGQKKAGISYNFTHMFNASVIQCRFTNIDGPGIDLFTIKGTNGYTPNCTQIESCTFTECGNATQPVIDYSWSESNSVTNCTIVTKNKAWYCGYRGTAQIMYNVNIDMAPARMVSGGAAVMLRSTRQVKNARPTGNILQKVTGTGPLRFINDAHDNVNMDTYFPNKYNGYEWAYPSLLVDCQFTNSTYDYALVATSKTGAITKTVAIEGGVRSEFSQVAKPAIIRNTAAVVFDLRGRRVTRVAQPSMAATRRHALPKGVYIMRPEERALKTAKVPAL